jgi:ribonuclease Z
VSGRDLVILGTAGQVPTRRRNHNGYLLRWDHEGILLDPGEGTQRQLTLAGVSASRITRICLSHLHGDHCLGLPGVLERLAQDGAADAIPIHYPESGQRYVERLCDASIGAQHPVHLRPVGAGIAVAGTPVVAGPPLRITARSLDHSVDALGWRIEEPGRHHLLADRLAALGLRGPAVGELARVGWIDTPAGRVTEAEVSEWRAGLSVAVVMDTRPCDAAVELAQGVDLLLCEATFLDHEAGLAAEHGHMTARWAATLARDAGVGRLVLTHLSARYPDPSGHRREASEVFGDVTVAEDLSVIDLSPAVSPPSPPHR